MQGLSLGLEGVVAVVTGAAQGNGRAIALGLAAAGARVACCDLQGDLVAALAEEMRAAGGSALGITLDVTKAASCAEAARQVAEVLGDTSVLVNNAGIIRRTQPDADTFAQDWDAVIAVNATGTMQMIQALLPHCARRRAASSISGRSCR
ncbi:SDR family oxidoreductase [Frigidibacter albus]